MKDPVLILCKPLISEKSSTYLEEGKYFFEVNIDANKIEIKKAVEKTFKVKVAKVNTILVKGKTKRQGRFIGKTTKKKKAIITLKEGKIDFEDVKI